MKRKEAIEVMKKTRRFNPLTEEVTTLQKTEALQLSISILERIQQLESIHPEDLEDSNTLQRVVKIINELTKL